MGLFHLLLGTIFLSATTGSDNNVGAVAFIGDVQRVVGEVEDGHEERKQGETEANVNQPGEGQSGFHETDADQRANGLSKVSAQT